METNASASIELFAKSVMDRVNAFPHREPWLHAVIEELRPLFERIGHPLPSNIRVACGFPSRRGIAPKRRALGECWGSTSSRDDHFEILVSPLVDDPMRVAGITVHELVHVLVGPGHRGQFPKIAKALGLKGRMTATIEGDAFKRSLEPILKSVGPYPHAELIVAPISGPKQQKGRLVKCVCEQCGYPIRTTRLWLDTKGPPLCPEHREELVEVSPDHSDEALN